jgi:hypothetical protein
MLRTYLSATEHVASIALGFRLRRRVIDHHTGRTLIDWRRRALDENRVDAPSPRILPVSPILHFLSACTADLPLKLDGFPRYDSRAQVIGRWARSILHLFRSLTVYLGIASRQSSSIRDVFVYELIRANGATLRPLPSHEIKEARTPKPQALQYKMRPQLHPGLARRPPVPNIDARPSRPMCSLRVSQRRWFPPMNVRYERRSLVAPLSRAETQAFRSETARATSTWAAFSHRALTSSSTVKGSATSS